jgi:3',5'-cyclic AMP phosphodiesterase CpdA
MLRRLTSIAVSALLSAMLAGAATPAVVSAQSTGPWFWDSVAIHYNGTDPKAIHGTDAFGYEWQCMELVQRYWYTKGWSPEKMWTRLGVPGAAKIQSAYQTFDPQYTPSFAIRRGNGQPFLPQAGDVLVFAKTTSWPHGHVAIVTGVSGGRVTFVQENVGLHWQDWLPITGTMAKGYRVSSKPGYPNVSGWLHPKATSVPPPATATAPPAPTNVTATGQDSSHVRIAWADNSGGQASYQVNRASGSQWVAIANVVLGSTSYTDGGLAASTTYQYLICAYNGAGTTCAANIVFGTTTAGQGQPPPAPTNLSAVALDANRIQLTWTDTSNGAAQFQVFEGGTYLATVSTGTSYVRTGLVAGSTHCYQVDAFDLFGTSAMSGSACLTTPPAAMVIPAAPTNVTATAINATTVRVAWTDNATNEQGFRVSDNVTTTLVGQNPSQGYTYFDYPTNPSTWECFHVQAFNSAGSSAWSPWSACLTTPPAAMVIPAAPTNVTATAINATTVRVAWTDNATNEQGFRVSDNVTTTLVGQNPSQGYTYFDYPTNPSTWECFHVQAFNSAGSSAWSPWSACLTTPPATASGPVIHSVCVTWIYPNDLSNVSYQILGTGLGVHTPYDADTTFLRINDLSQNWVAGYVFSYGFSSVTLAVSNWNDTGIAMDHYSGVYGQYPQIAYPGDSIQIEVWNPQTGAGPATYQFQMPSTNVCL